MSGESATPTAENNWVAAPDFDVLYGRFRSAVYSFSYYLTKDQGEAEDLYQEAWLRIVKHLPDRVNMKSLKTWIFTIVANLHRDNLRKKRVRQIFLRHKHKEAEVGAAGEAKPTKNPTRDAALLSDLGRDIARAIEKLPERQRQVFVLKEISGFKQAEICDILGIPIGTVKSLMFRAVRRLQKELAVYQPQPTTKGVEDAM